MSTHDIVTIVIISNVDNRADTAYDNHNSLVQEVCLSGKQYSNVQYIMVTIQCTLTGLQCVSSFWLYTRSSAQTQGGVWKLITGRKAVISNQRMNSSSSVTNSPDREPPVEREADENGKIL